MKTRLLICLVLGTLVLSSCSVILPVTATSNPIGSKVGEASGTGYLHFLYFDVDASIAAAAKNGGITRISTVDFRVEDTVGIVQKYTTIVTGE